jgi:hypothetical protein
MEHPKATPKDFFLWAGAMLSLYAGVIAFISLIFDYINYAFPDSLAYYADPYASASYEMAALIVLAPLFLALMRLVRRDMAKDASRGEVWVRRWALYLTVFVAGATIAIDLITLVYTFLSGQDITARFLLKVAVVLLVAGAGFMHFLADIWGYWMREQARAQYVTWGVGVLVAVSIAAGFFIIGTPGQARQVRLDAQRVQDLQNIQSQIVYYWQQKEALPADLAELNDPLSYWQEPQDPATGMPYRYERQSALGFTLCATFAAAGTSRGPMARPVEPAYGTKGQDDNWAHAAGEACFSRSIDPERYPPLTKTGPQS